MNRWGAPAWKCPSRAPRATSSPPFFKVGGRVPLCTTFSDIRAVNILKRLQMWHVAGVPIRASARTSDSRHRCPLVSAPLAIGLNTLRAGTTRARPDRRAKQERAALVRGQFRRGHHRQVERWYASTRHAGWRSGTSLVGARCAGVRSRPPRVAPGAGSEGADSIHNPHRRVSTERRHVYILGRTIVPRSAPAG